MIAPLVIRHFANLPLSIFSTNPNNKQMTLVGKILNAQINITSCVANKFKISEEF